MDRQLLAAVLAIAILAAAVPVCIADGSCASSPAHISFGDSQDDAPEQGNRTAGLIVIGIFLAFMFAGLFFIIRYRTKEKGWRLTVFSRRRNNDGKDQ